jgi:hypothetical protein
MTAFYIISLTQLEVNLQSDRLVQLWCRAGKREVLLVIKLPLPHPVFAIVARLFTFFGGRRFMIGPSAIKGRNNRSVHICYG